MKYELSKLMRAMAWQRAKGELQSMTESFLDATNEIESDKFLKLTAAIDGLISEVEDNELHC